MGRALHQLRLALGRGFDKPPDWSSLCPPYEEELVSMGLPVMLKLSLEDTTEDAIVDHLRATGSMRPQYCGMIVQSGSEVRLLAAADHPKSVSDGYAAVGRHATLRFIQDVRQLSVGGIPHSKKGSPQPSAPWPPIHRRLVLEISDQEFRRLIRDQDDQHEFASARSLIRLICEKRRLNGSVADYELSVIIDTQTKQSDLNNAWTTEHFFKSEAEIQNCMNTHQVNGSPTYRLWKRSHGDDGQKHVSISSRITHKAQSSQYRLTAPNNNNVERYSMSHNRSYDSKGRPKAASGQQSRQDFEERLVMAQNSILVTGGRRLGRANVEDEPGNEQVPDMPEDN